MRDIERVSDQQLCALWEQVTCYDRSLRALIRDEWNKRGLSPAQFPKSSIAQAFEVRKAIPLAWHWCLLVAMFPFPSPAHPIIAAQLLDHGWQRKFKDFYNYRALGFAIWFGIVLLLGSHFPKWILKLQIPLPI